MWLAPWFDRIGVLKRSGRDTRDAGTQRKGHVRALGEDNHLQAKDSVLSRNQTLLRSWSWTSSVQNCEKINFCCLSRPFCHGSPRTYYHITQSAIHAPAPITTCKLVRNAESQAPPHTNGTRICIFYKIPGWLKEPCSGAQASFGQGLLSRVGEGTWRGVLWGGEVKGFAWWPLTPQGDQHQ